MTNYGYCLMGPTGVGWPLTERHRGRSLQRLTAGRPLAIAATTHLLTTHRAGQRPTLRLVLHRILEVHHPLTRVLEAVGQLGEGFGFDLADALAGQAERFADLLERVRLMVVEAEPHSQDGRLALVHD